MFSALPQNAPLIDVQVNGAMGIDFSNPNLTLEDVENYCQVMSRFGVPYHVPTIITTSIEVMVRNAEIIALAMKQEWGKGILGIHLEGPYLDPLCHGAHPVDQIVSPNIEDTKRIFQAAQENILWTTMSPRTLDGEDSELRSSYIKSVREMGIVVSIGHHSASLAEIEAAINIGGATGYTHFGNAMSREPRVLKNSADLVGLCALAAPSATSEGVTVMVVPDGEHVPLEFIRSVCMLTHGEDLRKHSFVLTSDQSPLAGLPDGTYEAFGGRSFTVANSNTTPFKRTYDLSGSYLDLRTATNWLLEQNIVDSGAVIRAATVNPLQFLKIGLLRTQRFGQLAQEVRDFF